MDDYTNKIYARPDESGTVVKLFSSVFEQPAPGDVLVSEGAEDYHAHVHLKYQLMDEHVRYNYRIVEGVIAAIPEADKPKPPAPVSGPSLDEQVVALKKELADLKTTVNANTLALKSIDSARRATLA